MDNMGLIKSPSALEVHKTIRSMGNYKSPALDGMTTTFYKHCWGIVNGAAVKEV